jgi:hypothetical protein
VQPVLADEAQQLHVEQLVVVREEAGQAGISTQPLSDNLDHARLALLRQRRRQATLALGRFPTRRAPRRQ